MCDVDWTALGTMIGGVATAVGVFAVIWAARQWREQKIAERRMEVAEQFVGAARQAIARMATLAAYVGPAQIDPMMPDEEREILRELGDRAVRQHWAEFAELRWALRVAEGRVVAYFPAKDPAAIIAAKIVRRIDRLELAQLIWSSREAYMEPEYQAQRDEAFGFGVVNDAIALEAELAQVLHAVVQLGASGKYKRPADLLQFPAGSPPVHTRPPPVFEATYAGGSTVTVPVVIPLTAKEHARELAKLKDAPPAEQPEDGETEAQKPEDDEAPPETKR